MMQRVAPILTGRPDAGGLSVLQSVVPPMPGRPEALYLQPGSGVPADPGEALQLPEGGLLRTDAFFNAFYLSHWRDHTEVGRLGVLCRSRRKLRIRAIGHLANGRTIVMAVWEHPGGETSSTHWLWNRATEGTGPDRIMRLHLEV